MQPGTNSLIIHNLSDFLTESEFLYIFICLKLYILIYNRTKIILYL